ncbi:MAG TPA: GntR family transcriptional regulator [Vicinamibacterales bacterium]|jgi:DNA-binding GntR family transcriptional regulator|nr:GntR family transcriptional regulator [Vicinamibacterales bacterium]
MTQQSEPSSLAAEAYAVVRQRILRGEIGLGQVISRRKLAAELSMSFLPVSEALLRLEFEGLLESRPRAGTRVRIPSPEDVAGYYVVREALEVQAAVLYTAQVTAAERTELKKLAARVDALHAQGDRLLYLGVHQKLHARIAEGSRCPALLEAIEKTQALASIWYCVMRPPRPEDSQTRHQDLADAVTSGDPVRAAQAVRDHITIARERTLETLQPYFDLRTATGRTFHRSDRRLKAHTPDLSQLH